MVEDGIICKNGCVEPYGARCSRSCEYLKIEGGKATGGEYMLLGFRFEDSLLEKHSGKCKCVCPKRQSIREPLPVGQGISAAKMRVILSKLDKAVNEKEAMAATP
jgi:hypothetical protein